MKAGSRSREFSGLTTNRSCRPRRAAGRIGREQLAGLLDEPRVPGDEAEAAALGDVEAGEVEAVDVQHPASTIIILP